MTVNGTAGSVVAPRRAATNVEQAADAAILASNVKKMRAVQLWNDVVKWDRAAARAELAPDVTQHRSTASGGPRAISGVFGSTPDAAALSSVLACIKAHESGNYTESSHPNSGSGAYQIIPSTFTAWFARWASATGYIGPHYEYAYQAPPAVQDALVAWMLTHGGAGNWSEKYGADPCTRGLPGGG